MKNHALRLYAPIVLLALAALACGLPVPAGSVGPTAIPVSTEAAGSFFDKWDSVTIGAGGEVTVTFTDQELTSLVALQLAQQPDLPIQNPQIHLYDGQIDFTAEAELEGVRTDVQMIVAVTVGETGDLEFEVTEATIGFLPMPVELVNEASVVIQQMLADEDLSPISFLDISAIEITDGQMTVTGRLSQ